MPFLKSKDYEYSKIYIVPKKETVTTEEKEKFENSKFLINSLLNGACVEISQNCYPNQKLIFLCMKEKI